MKIAFIVGTFPSLSETFILDQITGLLDMGHDVEIFSISISNDDKVHPNVEKYQLLKKVHFLGIPNNKIICILKGIYLVITNLHKSPGKIFKSLNIFKYKKSALSLKLLYSVIQFRNRDFDIVHCHFGTTGIIGSKIKDLGIQGKYITSFHGYDVNGFPLQYGKNVYNDLFKKCDLFTTNTEFTKKRVIELGGDKNKIIVLPMSLNIEKFEFQKKSIKSGETIKIVTISRLVEKKGIEYGIKALVNVIKNHKNILYLIAGDGPLKYDLEHLVITLGISKYVKFLGALKQDEVITLYKQSHIFLLPCVTASDGDREGQALVLQEAQAVGLPVISTLHNGIPEGVLNGKSGFLVPERDINALTEKIEYLIEHPEVWQEMGKVGRKFVEDNYNNKILNQKLAKIYESLMND